MSWVSKQLLSATLRYTSTRAPVADNITRLLGDGLAKVVPGDDFEVEIGKKVITLYGRGSCLGRSVILATAATWLLPIPTRKRITMIFYGYPREVQEVISAAKQTSWPAPDMMLKMRVAADAVHIWWGSDDDEKNAVLKMPPISRVELGFDLI